MQVSSLLVNRSLVRGHGVVRPTLLNDAIQLSKNVGGKIKTRFVYTDNESGVNPRRGIAYRVAANELFAGAVGIVSKGILGFPDSPRDM